MNEFLAKFLRKQGKRIAAEVGRKLKEHNEKDT